LCLVHPPLAIDTPSENINMSINYQHALKAEVSHDHFGVFLVIYNPAEHGTVEEFKHRMTALHAGA
ncbi:hypothetical protein J8J17_22900, partial [Mycobacterium tuberculosis]|nr:hypothetical protein [Mycobacterium tuberculosis]